jgi:hypothetical protein
VQRTAYTAYTEAHHRVLCPTKAASTTALVNLPSCCTELRLRFIDCIDAAPASPCCCLVVTQSYTFKFTVRGRGGHAAIPHLNIDPVPAAAALITALQTLVSRETSPLGSAVLSVTQLQVSIVFLCRLSAVSLSMVAVVVGGWGVCAADMHVASNQPANDCTCGDMGGVWGGW